MLKKQANGNDTVYKDVKRAFLVYGKIAAKKHIKIEIRKDFYIKNPPYYRVLIAKRVLF